MNERQNIKTNKHKRSSVAVWGVVVVTQGNERSCCRDGNVTCCYVMQGDVACCYMHAG